MVISATPIADRYCDSIGASLSISTHVAWISRQGDKLNKIEGSIHCGPRANCPQPMNINDNLLKESFKVKGFKTKGVRLKLWSHSTNLTGVKAGSEIVIPEKSITLATQADWQYMREAHCHVFGAMVIDNTNYRKNVIFEHVILLSDKARAVDSSIVTESEWLKNNSKDEFPQFALHCPPLNLIFLFIVST